MDQLEFLFRFAELLDFFIVDPGRTAAVIADAPKHEADGFAAVFLHPAFDFFIRLAPVGFIGVVGSVAGDFASVKPHPVEVLGGEVQHIRLRTAEDIGIVSGVLHDVDKAARMAE